MVRLTYLFETHKKSPFLSHPESNTNAEKMLSINNFYVLDGYNILILPSSGRYFEVTYKTVYKKRDNLKYTK